MKKIISLFIILLIFVLSLCSCGKNEITGDEWFMKQDEYMVDLQTFTEGMDEVYSLYISGSISAVDFKEELRLLKMQYSIIQADYTEAKNDNPILPEEYSYAAQKGINAAENIRRLILKILNETLGENGEPLAPEQLSYMYMAYGQELNKYLADYITAYQIIKSETEDIKNGK